MIEFKRTKTEFQGGDLPRNFDRMGRTDYVAKQEVTIVGAHNEDEDEWKIRLADGSQYIVDGSDLRPHPEDRETNVEFLTRIMEWSQNGALMQGFVIEAIAKYAEQVQQMPEDQRERMNKGFIPYGPWKACADEVLAAIEARR